MASSSYSYDEESTHAPFFILTLAGIFAVPITYSIFKKTEDLENTGTRIESDFKPKDEDIIQAQRRKQKRKERKTKRIISACVLWGVIVYMVYLIAVTKRIAPQIWDPYDVLGVSRTASEKEIDRFYKKASIRYHPDKAKPDPAKNETLETINDRWVEMTKAYKALTDEEVRQNYLMYGNPDGKQSTNVGIAIPQWVIAEGNRWAVIAFYATLLGILLPYLVGKWWYGTQALTKEKVLLSSASKLFKEYKEDITQGGVLAALSAGDEYESILKGGKADRGAAKIESAVLASGALQKDDIEKLKSIEDPIRRKTLCLLWAYQARIDLGSEDLNRQKYEVAPAALQLNNSFSNITLPFLQTEPLINSYRTAQNLIQALTPNSSPALQLPHFTAQLANPRSGSNSKAPPTIQNLMRLPAGARRQACSSLSDEQYSQAMSIAGRIPALKIERAFFKVIGDRVVTPGSLVQLVVKLRAIPPGTAAHTIPPIDPEDLKDIDPEEGDIDAIKGRKKPITRKRRNSEGKVIGTMTEKEENTQPPLAYAPFFAADHAPRWHIFLAESRSGRIAVPPFTFTSFDRPIFTSDGKPTFNVVTLKAQFQAPPQVHAFPFTMHLICDSYVGFDSKVDVVLDVRDVSEAAKVESDDEISEPDEDSLAGQLQAMKTGEGPKPKGRKVIEEVESDDESDTEGEEDDTSDTDTETEDEG
ncbi:secretory subunit [Exophiala xenobiotica]|uniref:Secretory subunit n=1 Tax=Lithohypha guttulata TaxID=1690604 RepID=A0ABR0K3C8_9EURO|nr:secretory subunit [Lithohypha guttulata]KAK5313160.1 secretory subunit [Exophiala xenobiotica]